MTAPRPAHVIDRLRRLAAARDRSVDTDLRLITLDDDDALALIQYLDTLEPRQ